MDIERALITTILDQGGFKEVVEARIRAEFFQDEKNQAVWEWLSDFYSNHALTPSVEVFEHQFPDYELDDSYSEPVTYFVGEMIELRKKKILQDTISGVRQFYDEGLTDDAIKWLSSSLQDLYHDTTKTLDEDFTETADGWLEAYLEQVRAGSLNHGIPTGFPFIETSLGGLEPGQLITIVGPPKSGKSTALLWSNICAHALAYKTLFTTFEMSNKEQALRHHCFRSHVNYNRLKFGKLTAAETRRLTKMLNGLSAMQPMLFTHDPSSVTTVSALAAKIAEHKPEIAYVDGVYLMECDVPGVVPGSAQALTQITRGLKRLAVAAKIPIVCTTQVLPSKYSPRAGIRIGDIGYTSSFAQDSDGIFGAEADPDNPGRMIVSVVAARNAAPGKGHYRIDFQEGIIEEIEEDSFEENGDDNVDE